MKPYITNTMIDRTHQLPYQIEGIDRSNLPTLLKSKKIKCYEIPSGQSLKACWKFRITLFNDDWLEFSSACTNIGNWKEIGSLNIRYAKSGKVLPIDEYQKNECSFEIQNVEQLILRDQDVISEAGLILKGEHSEFIIAAGVPPGSVSIKITDTDSEFEPEFNIEDYVRQIFRVDF